MTVTITATAVFIVRMTTLHVSRRWDFHIVLPFDKCGVLVFFFFFMAASPRQPCSSSKTSRQSRSPLPWGLLTPFGSLAPRFWLSSLAIRQCTNCRAVDDVAPKQSHTLPATASALTQRTCFASPRPPACSVCSHFDDPCCFLGSE